MAARKFSNKELPHIHEKISELWLKGATEAQIADELGITQQAVNYHKQKIEEETLNRIGQNIEARRGQSIDSARLIKHTSWKILQSTDCPRIQLSALATIGHADDRIMRACHIDKIPPPSYEEEQSKEQLDAELADFLQNLTLQDNQEMENEDEGVIPDNLVPPPAPKKVPPTDTSVTDTKQVSRTRSVAGDLRKSGKAKKPVSKKTVPDKVTA